MVINSSDFYKMFKKENKHISKMEYEQVLDTLFAKIFSTLKEGKSYELPFKLGCFKIIKYKGQSGNYFYRLISAVILYFNILFKFTQKIKGLN